MQYHDRNIMCMFITSCSSNTSNSYKEETLKQVKSIVNNNVYKTDKRDTNEIRSRAAFHGKDAGKDSIHRGLDPRYFPALFATRGEQNLDAARPSSSSADRPVERETRKNAQFSPTSLLHDVE